MIRKSLLLLCFAPLILQAAHAQSYDWEITSFDSEITIHSDTSFHVKEDIGVAFSTQRHGIYRDIPVSYKDNLGQPYTMSLDNISVSHKDGSPWEISVSNNSPYKRIRIGSADTYLTGPQEYIIEYDVSRAYTKQKSSDYGSNNDRIEFFWNTTGTWDVPILHASQHYILPDNYSGPKDIICFQGYTGSTTQGCTVDHKNMIVSSTAVLLPSEQMSVGLSLDSSMFTLPTPLQEAYWYLKDNFMLSFAILLGIYIIVLWYLRGRELPLGIVVADWKVPDNISPLQASVLHSGLVSVKEFSAAIIALASQGYLTIKKNTRGGGYTFIKKVNDTPLSKEMQKLMDSLFGGKKSISTSNLKNKFYTHIPSIEHATYAEVTQANYYEANPDSTRVKYIVMGTILASFGAFVCLVMEQYLAMGSYFILEFLWIPFAFTMPRKTLKGRDMERRLKGLALYIKRAEQYRFKVLQSPQKAPKEFERLLPYAMIFGLEKEWAAQFKDIYTTPPQWYDGNIDSFNAMNLVSALQSMSKTTSSSLASSPPSSSSSSSFSSSGGSSFSGGFSGGGFGGGGGGSW